MDKIDEVIKMAEQLEITDLRRLRDGIREVYNARVKKETPPKSITPKSPDKDRRERMLEFNPFLKGKI